MNAYLTRLGVPKEIQAFFKTGAELFFDYGDCQEHFAEGFHKIPTTRNLWLAGNDMAMEVIISYSAMEAIAFLTTNRIRYPRLEQLACIAIGNRLHAEQTDWIRKNFRVRKFTLVFSKDLPGHITDIKLAAALQNSHIRVAYAQHNVIIYRQDQIRIFEDDQVSLHQFKLAFGIRGSVRTRKPTQTATYLEHLKHDAER